MNWINKLERKFERYAIHNLMHYIIILYAVGFVLNLIAPGFYMEYLSLNANAILHGQIWRIVTFLLQPPDGSPIFIVFALYLYYMIGQNLEAAWGAFRFNLYFFTGVLFHLIAALIVYFLTGISFPIGTSYLNLSLFFAFAALYPNVEFLLFFVIPIKVKYLALLDGAFFAFTILQGILPAYAGGVFGIMYKADAIAAFVSLLNFLIFYVSSRNMKAYSNKHIRNKCTGQNTLMPMEQDTDVLCVAEQNWTIRIWSFGIVQSAMAITNIARIIYLRMSMSNDFETEVR